MDKYFLWKLNKTSCASFTEKLKNKLWIITKVAYNYKSEHFLRNLDCQQAGLWNLK